MKTHRVKGAPAAIGPYSHATEVAGLVFCSGQTPLDPVSGELVGENVGEQTAQVLENLETVLAGLGLTLRHVVKTTVFLRDMADFEEMNRVYAERFGTHRPARTTVAVRQNPLDAMVEIECVAARGGGA